MFIACRVWGCGSRCRCRCCCDCVFFSTRWHTGAISFSTILPRHFMALRHGFSLFKVQPSGTLRVSTSWRNGKHPLPVPLRSRGRSRLCFARVILGGARCPSCEWQPCCFANHVAILGLFLDSTHMEKIIYVTFMPIVLKSCASTAYFQAILLRELHDMPQVKWYI